MISLDKVPSNLEQALEILEGMDKKDKDYIAKKGSPSVHHGFGTWIRNNWSLWEKDTPIVIWFNKQGIRHADDMSGIILEAFERKLKNEPFDLQAKIKYYRDYWVKAGLDPDTM